MRIDAHVHMHGQEKDSGEFMKRLEMAGFDGAVVFSTAPRHPQRPRPRQPARALATM